MTDYRRDDEVYIPRQKYAPRFDATDVYALRDDRECSLMEAKSILMRHQILEDLEKGRNSHDIVLLYDILEYVLKNKLI